MLNEITLFSLTTITSAIAGICGLGGGMILALTLPIFLAPAAIIPIHGVTQLASNSSRLIFAFKDVHWPFVPQFVLGGIIGTALFSIFLVNLPNDYIPLFISTYLLLSLWLKAFSHVMNKIENFYVVGCIQAGLGLLVGAPGPLTITFLMKRLEDKNQIIATASVLMALTNLNKIIVYGFLGFHFSEYLDIMAITIIGATLGSFIGTKLRNKIPNKPFMRSLKWLITLMALYTLTNALISLGMI